MESEFHSIIQAAFEFTVPSHFPNAGLSSCSTLPALTDFFNYYLMHMVVLPVCYVCVTHVFLGFGSPGTGIRYDC